MSVASAVSNFDVHLVGTDWWANGSVITAGVLAALIAACVAVLGYSHQKKAARRERRAGVYATAVQVVEDYLEGPYRIRRRDGSLETRNALTRQLSDTKSSIEYFQTLLHIHGSPEVANAYAHFVEAARLDAGPAMTQAWRTRPARRDADVPLGAQLFNRSRVEQARVALISTMRRDLAH